MKDVMMAPKVNYGFQKAERDRAKQAKKAAKAREKAANKQNNSEQTPAGVAAEPPVEPQQE